MCIPAVRVAAEESEEELLEWELAAEAEAGGEWLSLPWESFRMFGSHFLREEKEK